MNTKIFTLFILLITHYCLIFSQPSYSVAKGIEDTNSVNYKAYIQYAQGMRSLSLNSIDSAEYFFNQSLKIRETIEAYHRVANIKIRQLDTCSFCDIRKKVLNLKGLYSEKFYDDYCIKTDTAFLNTTKKSYIIRIYDICPIKKSIEIYNPKHEPIYCEWFGSIMICNPIKMTLPEFPNGDDARLKYLIDNVRYPSKDRDLGYQGTVFVTFIIEVDGTITNIEILRGISEGLDNEVIRVVSSMPNWIPGTKNGKKIRVRFNMPLRFVIHH